MDRMDPTTTRRRGLAPFSPFRGPGFTLVELLAVIVIISLVAGLAVGQLASVSESAVFRAAVTRIADLDARGRLLGRSGSQTSLISTSLCDGLLLRERQNGDVLAQIRLPDGLKVYLRTTTGQSESIRFDASGRSCDYTIILEREAQFTSYIVSGLTGRIIREEESR